jgi:hypothetical protein
VILEGEGHRKETSRIVVKIARQRQGCLGRNQGCEDFSEVSKKFHRLDFAQYATGAVGLTSKLREYGL